MDKPVLFIRYLDNMKNMSSYIDNNRKLSAQNKLLLDSLAGRSPSTLGAWIDKQLKIYGTNGQALNELNQKHVIASGMVQQYPELRDKFLSGEKNLDSINLPVILSITILSGAVMTLYDSVAFKIKLQNKYLLELDAMLNKYTNGQVSDADLLATVNNMKDYVYKPPVNIGGALLIGGLIFAGFYFLTQPDKARKLLKAVN